MWGRLLWWQPFVDRLFVANNQRIFCSLVVFDIVDSWDSWD